MHAIALVLLLGLAAAGPEARPPAEAEFIVVPLRVHVLSAPDLDMANCRLTDAEIRRVVANLNAIWHPAGIRFGLESLVREPAAQRDRFRLLFKKGEMQPGFPEVALLFPPASRDFDGLHAYFFHQSPYNSSLVADDAVVVQEGAAVRQVLHGGGNDTIVRVLAHALARALAVPNSGDEQSLMANGSAGVALDARQAARARQVARTIPGAATVAEARRAAAAPRPRAQPAATTPTPTPADAPKPVALGAADDPGPTKDEFLIVPLRVHIMTAPDLELANCRLTDADAARVLEQLNAIWHRARIHFGLESIRREPPDQVARYRSNTDGQPGVFAWPERLLLPRSSRTFDGLHAYYFHTFPINGAHLGGDAVLVQEGAQVQPVDGGTDNPMARVTAHALGYAFGLPDDFDPANLMSQGTSGTALDDAQVESARAVARTIHGVAAAADIRKAALAAQAKDERSAEARRLWAWLAELPGPGAAEARRRRDRIDRLNLP